MSRSAEILRKAVSEQREKRGIVSKGDSPGHEFRGNQYTIAASRARAASDKADAATVQTRLGRGTAASHKTAMEAHYDASGAHMNASRAAAAAGMKQQAEDHEQASATHQSRGNLHSNRANL